MSSEGLAANRLPGECESCTFTKRGLWTVQVRNEILPGEVIHNLSTLAHGTPSETIPICLVYPNL